MGVIIGPTFGRYLLMRFFKAILAVFATIFVLIYTLDFVELVRRAGETPGISTGLLARLALYRTPSVAEQILPFAVLFGAMAALLDLSRKLELVIARAAGISVWQFLFPGLAVAALIGIVGATLYNPVAAFLREAAQTLETAAQTRPQSGPQQDLWLRQKNGDGQAIIRAERANPSGETLLRVSLFEFSPDGHFLARVEAQEARLRDGYWELSKARVVQPGIEPDDFDTYLLATSLTADQFRQSFSSVDIVPFWSLPRLIDQTEQAGLDATRYRLQFQSLMALPALLMAMVLVAASVSLRFFRFGGVARMALGGIAAGFVLYIATQLVEALGAAGLLSTGVAAWAPALLGGLLGSLALLYQEDG